MPFLGSFSPTLTHSEPDNLSPPPTRFYFHAASSTVSGTLPSTEQSTLTSNKDVDAQTVNRSMDTTIGSSVATLALTSNGTTSAQNYYFTKFVSPPINQTAIAANTWTYTFATTETGNLANFPVTATSQPVWINVYVWRPSTGAKVGTILDGNTRSNVREGVTTNKLYRIVNFTGSSVSSVQSGDVIVCEIWFQVTQGSTSVFTDTFYYDGGTVYGFEADPADDAASYVETPEVLVFAGQNITRSLSDTITVSDSAGRVVTKARAIAQTVTVSESLARVAGKNRALATQTITVSDSLARLKGAVKTISQTVTVSDSLARLAAKTRAIAETITVSDSLTRIAGKSRALATETIIVSDAITRVKGAVKTLSETITVSDSISRVADKVRTLAETITVSDSVDRIAGKIRALSESITISDSVSNQVSGGAQHISRTITEAAISVSDSVDRLAEKTRALAETVTVTDAVSRSKATVRALSETVTVGAGVVSRLKGVVRTLSQTVTVSDSLTRLTAKLRSLAESMSISDSVSQLVTPAGANNVVRTIVEAAITVTDAVDYVVEHVPFVPSTGGGGALAGVRRTLQEERRRRQELEKPLPKIVERQLYEKITVKDDLQLKVTKTPESFDAMLRVIMEPIKPKPVEASAIPLEEVKQQPPIEKEKPKLRMLDEVSRILHQVSMGQLEVLPEPSTKQQKKPAREYLHAVPFPYPQSQEHEQHEKPDNKRHKFGKLAKIATIMKLKQLFDLMMTGDI